MTPATSGDHRAAALFRERVRRVFREFPGALAGEEEPVHQVRVAGRRLRVALPLLARKAKGRRLKRARRILGELTRAAGTGRDLDVQVGLYEKHLEDLEAPSPEQREILRRMKAARARTRARLANGILDLNIDRLRRDLRKIRSRGPARASAVLKRTRAVRKREGAALLQGLLAVGNAYDPEALHALRRQVRQLRYAAEVDDAVRGQESGASDTWKRLQDGIGVLHDAHVLAGWLARQAQRASSRGQRVLAAAAEAEGASFEAEARRLHQKLLDAGPIEIAAKALGKTPPSEPKARSRRKSTPATRSPVARAAYRAAPQAVPPTAAL